MSLWTQWGCLGPLVYHEESAPVCIANGWKGTHVWVGRETHGDRPWFNCSAESKGCKGPDRPGIASSSLLCGLEQAF